MIFKTSQASAPTGAAAESVLGAAAAGSLYVSDGDHPLWREVCDGAQFDRLVSFGEAP
jgi:hypothetical protein